MKPAPQTDGDICDACQALYEDVGDLARDTNLFEKVRRSDHALLCKAKHVESEAHYTVHVGDDHDMVYVGLQTPDRWLSESIEADLMHLGEKIEELLEEELIEQGLEENLPVEHFRDDAKLYIFRSPLSLPENTKLESEQMVERVMRVLKAYEACFRELGDMSEAEAF